ncbi:hypothetical protein QTJ16_004634 [Diplocarpon rosae]|uniref:HAUS augmin-like complex subunit 6 N-terminal domain-containing protein n=1 Tax=Diplocarpon rosae TaxID=946125 RepID=A0AAD9WCE2_9HELO|nr:hypothetical protein QTJ16_004634 [Diplocarpon rosae]
MSSATSKISHARSRSLRVPPPNLVKSATTIQPAAGPSNVALFLTNMRLLDLDLRPDWPDISALTFSTKDAQQNQKKRIQCVEWALYQLFALWDPEETRNKLQPFFPPLEPLQSLNLRAALFRCLDQAKKNGTLGRDTVLRKTMLDECKGDRLDEVLAVFSNAVLKKVLQSEGSGYEALAQQLALENFSYSGERTVLSALIVSHRASLTKHLQGRADARARYRDFSDLLNLNERRIARRQEQLKLLIQESGMSGSLSQRDIYELQDTVQKNWSGNTGWLESILYGDNRSNADGILASRFDKIWKRVESGSIAEIEGTNHAGLLEQLDARVKDQEKRLARWQNFGNTLSKSAGPSPIKANTAFNEASKIDLKFNQHQELQVGRSSTKMARLKNVWLDEYTRLLDNMRAELSAVSKPTIRPRAPRQTLAVNKRSSVLNTFPGPKKKEALDVRDEEWSSASDSEQDAARPVKHTTEAVRRTPSPEAHLPIQVPLPQTRPSRPPVPKFSDDANPARPVSTTSPAPYLSSLVRPVTPPTLRSPPSVKPLQSESDLADQILNSVSASSPSPKKSRHTLSLAERTRLSMSRTFQSQSSDLQDDSEIVEPPRLSINSRPSLGPRTPSLDVDPHADLIERTRKSMAGFEAAQKKAQVERRRSVKDAKTKQRQSSYFPKVEEEAPVPDISAADLIEGDPDYESVFKSRPKIATSPAISPTRIWEQEEE